VPSRRVFFKFHNRQATVLVTMTTPTPHPFPTHPWVATLLVVDMQMVAVAVSPLVLVWDLDQVVARQHHHHRPVGILQPGLPGYAAPHLP
jgi:hypothetical protein